MRRSADGADCISDRGRDFRRDCRLIERRLAATPAANLRVLATAATATDYGHILGDLSTVVGSDLQMVRGDLVRPSVPLQIIGVPGQAERLAGWLADRIPALPVSGVVYAAAQVPARSNLTDPVRLGAGLVAFSGGKGLRGPQSSGLVVGKAELIEAARMNGSPASSVGRGMKVGKEELMGLLAEVELFLDGSDEEDYRHWCADAELIVAGLQGIDDVRATVEDGDALFFPDGVPRVRIEMLGERTADAYGAPLHDGEPRILMGGWDGGMFVDPMTLRPGEAQHVARRLREVLTQG